jgi:hypothetical protein
MLKATAEQGLVTSPEHFHSMTYNPGPEKQGCRGGQKRTAEGRALQVLTGS